MKGDCLHLRWYKQVEGKECSKVMGLGDSRQLSMMVVKSKSRSTEIIRPRCLSRF